ncbi:MAG: efflux RND transporter periplasmic adaptor subunit [bacterium]|nr:efflux RND transporter periplasmic adaptor subunit [bacterium]
MRILLICVFLIIGANAFAQSHSEHDAGNAPKAQEGASDNGKIETKTEATRIPIEVPVERQVKIGLKVATTEKKKVEHTIRTIGTVTADETKEAHVHTKIKGWIERVHADYVGKPVQKGQPLYDLYSPDLIATQEEYLAARQQGSIGREIAATALDRLKLWGVSQTEIERLEKTGKSNRAVTFNSPADGFILAKMAVQGMYITPEMELYRITDLSRLWIIASLYESDIAVISDGDEASISLPHDANKSFTGKISYIYPEIEEVTRTAKARIEVDNQDLRLKPGMFANVELRKNLGESIVVPDDAVIDTGTRSLVFVKTDASRFEPREVKVGPRVEDTFIILSGIASGEEVVISAHFLIDAESKFQAAIQKGAPSQAGHAGMDMGK